MRIYPKEKKNTFLKELKETEINKYECREEIIRRKKLKELKETMWKKSRQDGENIQDGENAMEKLEFELEKVEDLVRKFEKEKAERMERKENLERVRGRM